MTELKSINKAYNYQILLFF